MNLSIADMMAAREKILRKAGFVPSGPAAGAGGGMPPDPSMGGGMPPGAPPGMPPGMPPDPSMGGGAPPMDPMAGGAPPMDPMGGGAPQEQLIAPDGTSPMGAGPAGQDSGGKGGGVKVKPEDIVMLTQQNQQILAELKLNRDLLLDMMTQTGLKINPDTLRSSVASAGSIVNPQQAGVQM